MRKTSKRLRAVFDKEQTLSPANRGERNEVNAAAEEMCHHENPRPWADTPQERFLTGCEGGRVKVHRDRNKPVVLGNARHVRVCHSREQDLAAPRQRKRRQQQVEPAAHREARDRG
jgi:hypothetical protein